MSSSVVTPEEEVTRQVSVWEDMIDIFYSPSAVFSRRSDGRFGIPLIVLVLLFAFIAFSSLSALAPLYEAEMMRGMQKALEANPELPAEQFEMGRTIGSISIVVMSALMVPALALVIGGILRLIGGLAGAALTFKLAAMITVYAQFPRLLQQLLTIIQGFVLPPESLTSRFVIGFGPARFMDPDSSSMLSLEIAERFDIFTIWATVLIAIGVRVLGKVPTGRAYLIAGVVWLIGVLPALLRGLMGQ